VGCQGLRDRLHAKHAKVLNADKSLASIAFLQRGSVRAGLTSGRGFGCRAHSPIIVEKGVSGREKVRGFPFRRVWIMLVVERTSRS
jgi:hypothetical protein